MNVPIARFRPDHRVGLIVTGNAAKLTIGDTHEMQGDLIAHAAPINLALFSSDSRLLVTASKDCIAKVWDGIRQAARCVIKVGSNVPYLVRMLGPCSPAATTAWRNYGI